MSPTQPNTYVKWVAALASSTLPWKVQQAAALLQSETVYPCMMQLHNTGNDEIARKLRMLYVLKTPKKQRANAYDSMISAACHANRAVSEGIPMLAEMRIMGVPPNRKAYVDLQCSLARQGQWSLCVTLFNESIINSDDLSDEAICALCDSLHLSGKWHLVASVLEKFHHGSLDQSLCETGISKILHTAAANPSEWYQAISTVIPWVLERIPRKPSHRINHALLMAACVLRRRVSSMWLEKIPQIQAKLNHLSPQNLALLIQCYENHWDHAVRVFFTSQMAAPRNRQAYFTLVRVLSVARKWQIGIALHQSISSSAKGSKSLIHTMNLVNCLSFSGKWEPAVTALQNVQHTARRLANSGEFISLARDERNGVSMGYRSLLYVLCLRGRWSEAVNMFRLSYSLIASEDASIFLSKQVNSLLRCCIEHAPWRMATDVSLKLLEKDLPIDKFAIALHVGILYENNLSSELVRAYPKFKKHCKSIDTLTMWRILLLALQSKSRLVEELIIPDIRRFIESERFADEIRSSTISNSFKLGMTQRKFSSRDMRLLKAFVSKVLESSMNSVEYQQLCENYFR